MNYSEEVKKEILCGKEKTDGEKKAFASAFLRSAGTLSVNGGKIGFEISTDNSFGANAFVKYFADVYSLPLDVSEEKSKRGKRIKVRYAEDATEILEDLGIIEVDGEGVKLKFGV